jgi:hypothetical protein
MYHKAKAYSFGGPGMECLLKSVTRWLMLASEQSEWTAGVWKGKKRGVDYEELIRE